ncbi:hypothetical protein GY45DRAFT_915194 [Cubamyces sp. BRFM 1775]|nr:hypothetical protein GY45DRAFT_915194 [Cubamyces sp. BRFM 1775]
MCRAGGEIVYTTASLLPSSTSIARGLSRFYRATLLDAQAYHGLSNAPKKPRAATARRCAARAKSGEHGREARRRTRFEVRSLSLAWHGTAHDAAPCQHQPRPVLRPCTHSSNIYPPPPPLVPSCSECVCAGALVRWGSSISGRTRPGMTVCGGACMGCCRWSAGQSAHVLPPLAPRRARIARCQAHVLAQYLGADVSPPACVYSPNSTPSPPVALAAPRWSFRLERSQRKSDGAGCC